MSDVDANTEAVPSAGEGTVPPAFADIPDLENEVDRHLARPRVKAEASRPLQRAAARWSQVVWAAAQARGPIKLRDVEVSGGLEVAGRPLFVCGAHRSGTTLVRDLLDGHPAVAVLPSEGTFFTNLERHLQGMQLECWLPYMGCEWLRRLVNPIHQQPYWLLGRSSRESSAYVEFARALMAWWPLTRAGVGNATSSWPLVAVALAYAHCSGGFSDNPGRRCWAEKTPTNERFLNRLRAEFPHAKFIHVVRHPFAVYASHKRAAQRAGERFSHAAQVLRDLSLSYRVAAEQSQGDSKDYLVIRYEDLIDNMQRTAARLAEFADIELLAGLMQPTAAGLPTMSNSSFPVDATPGRVYSTSDRVRWNEPLTRFDRERISAAVGAAAAGLGYQLDCIAPWRLRLARFGLRIAGKLP